MALGILLSRLTVILVAPIWPQTALVAPTFFLMGCACALPTVTLWRAVTPVYDCGAQGRVAGHPLGRLSHRFRAR